MRYSWIVQVGSVKLDVQVKEVEVLEVGDPCRMLRAENLVVCIQEKAKAVSAWFWK